ncbi:DrmB family protein [Agromyces sp. Marseille-Q5079]|uniref:DrmB family protein n=1 Tax=Agromyces sp. Marseille-Q5079 TaxID=3439059 RepID=UPI003D9C843F
MTENERTEASAGPAAVADAVGDSDAAVGAAAAVAAVGIAGDVADPFLETSIKPKNRARVGSIRPSAMLYTSGIGSSVDLPHIAVMPQGIDAWDNAYARMGGEPSLVLVPRLIEAVRRQLGSQVGELRQPPWLPDVLGGDTTPIGIPTRVFPQWLRCTGCDLLAPVSANVFEFENTRKHRPDMARFFHRKCKGRFKGPSKGFDRVAVPARYLIACTNGHLDEFPYNEWIHGADGNRKECVANPQMRMREWRSNLGPQVSIVCVQCDASRNIAELTRAGGEASLPNCRGRHPHLPSFASASDPCKGEVRLMLLGAANQWFPATIGVLVLPSRKEPKPADTVDEVMGLPPALVAKLTSLASVQSWREFASEHMTSKFAGITDDDLWQAIQVAKGELPPLVPAAAGPVGYDPNHLLVPEWQTLTHPDEFLAEDQRNGFKVHPVPVAASLGDALLEVIAVDRIRKANAFIGFTRIDAFDRVGDDAARIAPIALSGKPKWVPATEDRGEGVFIRISEPVVAAWEESVLHSDVWAAHVAAHERNLARRQSRTTAELDPDERMPPPRYWALHTLSHLLIREMAMSSGYGSASLSERIYAWRETDDRAPAAGILITTTSPDSEGTLGGLVDLARTERLEEVVLEALHRAQRCSSDPICAHRVPKDQEDFLHGAACHFCGFLSETSCERANRFLDRRFVLDLNAGSQGLAPLLTGVDLGALESQ